MASGELMCFENVGMARWGTRARAVLGHKVRDEKNIEVVLDWEGRTELAALMADLAEDETRPVRITIEWAGDDA